MRNYLPLPLNWSRWDWFLACSVFDLSVWWLRARRTRRRGERFWWPWFIYQVMSGYPAGELEHWPDYPFKRKGSGWMDAVTTELLQADLTAAQQENEQLRAERDKLREALDEAIGRLATSKIPEDHEAALRLHAALATPAPVDEEERP